MKKSNLVVGILYTLAGIAFFIAALLTHTPLEGLFCGFAGAGIGPGILIIAKYCYWTSPKNQQRYQEKLEQERIELQDELMEKVRGKTAQYVYVLGLCVSSVAILLFAVLDALQIIQSGELLILYLGLYMILQLISGQIIFRHLMKKY